MPTQKDLVRVVVSNRMYLTVIDPKTKKEEQREVNTGESVVIPKEVYLALTRRPNGRNPLSLSLVEDLSPKEDTTKKPITPDRADPAGSLAKKEKAVDKQPSKPETKATKKVAEEQPKEPTPTEP